MIYKECDKYEEAKYFLRLKKIIEFWSSGTLKFCF